MNRILKFFIILILLAAIIFIVEVMKILTKIYSMVYYIDKDKCFKILCEIDDLCKKYGVKYYLSEGTALGIYRNGDLIDWDDDIDIGIPRNQYEKSELLIANYYRDKGNFRFEYTQSNIIPYIVPLSHHHYHYQLITIAIVLFVNVSVLIFCYKHQIKVFENKKHRKKNHTQK